MCIFIPMQWKLDLAQNTRKLHESKKLELMVFWNPSLYIWLETIIIVDVRTSIIIIVSNKIKIRFFFKSLNFFHRLVTTFVG